MAARNQAKAADARDEILAAHPVASLEVVELDLGSLASVEAAAETIAAAHDRIDILMCNAGVMALPQGTTDDGFDTQMGINVLGHWALLSHLLPIVVATPGARVVTLSSTAQHTGRAIDPDDPHMREGFDAWGMYGQTKLAMRHLAVGPPGAVRRGRRRRQGAVGPTRPDQLRPADHHPAARRRGPPRHRLREAWSRSMGMSTDRGALSQLRAATDPDAPGGGFYGPLFATNGPPVRKPLVRPGSDAAIAALWEVGEPETGLKIDVSAAARRAVTATGDPAIRGGRHGTRTCDLCRVKALGPILWPAPFQIIAGQRLFRCRPVTARIALFRSSRGFSAGSQARANMSRFPVLSSASGCG